MDSTKQYVVHVMLKRGGHIPVRSTPEGLRTFIQLLERGMRHRWPWRYRSIVGVALPDRQLVAAVLLHEVAGFSVSEVPTTTPQDRVASALEKVVTDGETWKPSTE